MDCTKFLKNFNRSDAYALSMRIKSKLKNKCEIAISGRADNNIMEIEMANLFAGKDSWFIKIAFIDNSCMVEKVTGNPEVEVGDVYEIFIDYCKDRFGPEYVSFLNDTAITY